MEKFYLTFGVKYHYQKHPYWGGVNPDGWITIEATDYGAARHLVNVYFGTYWGFLYDSKHFNTENNKMRYYPRGELVLIREGEEVDPGYGLVPRFSTSDPGYYGEESDSHLGNRVEGKLKPRHEPNPETYDVEYFHDKCLPDGYGMFESITEVDTHVLNFEMDWANPWTCLVCGRELNK